ncbi:MAG TPA: cation transporter [Planctomycetota bacterium]
MIVMALLLALAEPDSKVELKGLHLCCGGCEGAAVKALEGTGAKNVMADKGAGTLTFMVKDVKAAQKAFDALGNAGFHAETGVPNLPMKDDSGVKPGKVKSLKLSGIHNCCGGCAKPIKEAAMKVEGVSGVEIAEKATTLTVNGDFDGAAVIKALNAAGYHAKLAK